MTLGGCRLCGAEAELRESHILPAFLYKWMKDTSVTGRIRLGVSPNRRVQDGLKRRWLCANCEARFSKWESAFAARIFHPYSSRVSARFDYDSFLIRFCTSVSWRALLFHQDEGYCAHLPEDVISRTEEAAEKWRAVLLERSADPNPFEQHLLPLEAIESHNVPEVPRNINRYLVRAIDMDVVYGRSSSFLYSKLGRFIILGFLQLNNPGHWQGTKVEAAGGFIEPKKYTLPADFVDYLFHKAKRLAELNSQISSAQRKKIEEAFRRNRDRIAKSDDFYALSHDVRLFGKAVFQRKSDETSESEQ